MEMSKAVARTNLIMFRLTFADLPAWAFTAISSAFPLWGQLFTQGLDQLEET